tara:strand:+ start:64 stop:237 length:174 start_codon:yes stop_codon:yes gene_type:complete
MWNWIKNLFRPRFQKDEHEQMYEGPEYTVFELQEMTKGDLKKLRAQGKIKSIAHPFY